MKIALSSLALATALATTPLLASGASAETRIGMLGCNSDGSTGFIIGSTDNLVCEFTPADGGAPELYAAALDKFGLDVGVTGRTVMSWAVVSADANPYTPNSLAGTYVGATADASVVVGGGASVLVGGTNDSFSLQPVSVQAQEGINAALGVAKFTLAPAVAVATPPAAVVVPVEPQSK